MTTISKPNGHHVPESENTAIATFAFLAAAGMTIYAILIAWWIMGALADWLWNIFVGVFS